MNHRTKTVRAVYQVSFTLEVEQTTDEEDCPPRPSPKAIAESRENLIEEAVTAVLDEELYAHDGVDGGTRCGVKFADATMFSVKLIEVREVRDA